MANEWKKFRKYKDDYLSDLKKIIEIDSSLTGDKKYPNDNIVKGVKTFMDIGKKFNMKTHMHPEGYYGYIEIGEGKEMIGIIGHMDVVPAGEIDVWETPPFEMTLTDDGFVRGRGVQDDKGPSLLTLYAMKILLDEKVPLTKRVRLIIGTDEESDWRGMEKYVAEQEIPTAGFTPDASWPLIYAEKLHLSALVSEKTKPTEKVSGGSASNVVPAKANIESDKADIIEKNLKDMKQKYTRDGNNITVIGKPHHAKDSDKGDNAIMKLARAIKGHNESNLLKFIDEMWDLNTFAPNVFGKKLEDKELGPLTTNVGVLELNDKGNLKAKIDVRVPHPKIDKDFVVKKLIEAVNKYDLELTWGLELPEVYIPKESKFIQTLMKSYKELTGDVKSEPLTSGGGTYAKTMRNVVAFGPHFTSSTSTIHQENEKVLLEEILKSGEIYTDTLVKLLELKSLK